MSRILSITVAAALLLGATSSASGQTLLGSDGFGVLTWDFTAAPGGPCGAPNPMIGVCPHGAALCGIAPIGPVPPGSFWGDIADDPLTDTVYVTDGRVIGSFAGDPPCGAGLCAAYNTFIPPFAAMGPLTGMGCDASGAFTGGPPLLWITDGVMVAGIIPPPAPACGPVTVVFPPCPIPGAGVIATDISWDPANGLLWMSFAAGFVQAFAVPGCAPATGPIAVGACPMGPLEGIAVDPATPNFTGATLSGYVTDGFTVAHIDLFTGAPAAPTFYSPITCNPTPAPINGLALSQHGVTYGASRVSATLDTFGQSSTPGPTFGLEVTGAPSTGTAFLILNFNFPGPGFLCPPLPGVGTKIWVDPSAPGIVIALPPFGPACSPIPLPIPAATPPGLELFAQMVFIGTTGPPAIDATNGIAATVALP